MTSFQTPRTDVSHPAASSRPPRTDGDYRPMLSE